MEIGCSSGTSIAPLSGDAAIPAFRKRPILVVAPQPFYEDRGTPIAVRYVIEALSSLGYEVDVLTLPLGRPVEIPRARLIRVGNPLRIQHVPVGLSLGKIVFNVLLIAALRRQLTSRDYACIHAVEEAAFYAVLLGRRRGVPVVYDMQSSLPEQLAQKWLFRVSPIAWVLRRFERWLLSNSRAVIASSGLAASARIAVPEAQITEWYFPSHTQSAQSLEIDQLRTRLAFPQGSRVVLYSGTFAEYQGLDHLLEAIPLVVATVPSIAFVFVGGSSAETEAVKRHPLFVRFQHCVRVIERQPRDCIPAFLATAEVLVSSRSHGGNLPLKIFDYLAAERPIVATDIPSHRMVLDDERAFLVAPDARGLASGIIEALTNSKRSENIVANARRYSQQHLTSEGFRAGLKIVYDRVTTGKPDEKQGTSPA